MSHDSNMKRRYSHAVSLKTVWKFIILWDKVTFIVFSSVKFPGKWWLSWKRMKVTLEEDIELKLEEDAA